MFQDKYKAIALSTALGKYADAIAQKNMHKFEKWLSDKRWNNGNVAKQKFTAEKIYHDLIWLYGYNYNQQTSKEVTQFYYESYQVISRSEQLNLLPQPYDMFDQMFESWLLDAVYKTKTMRI